VTDQEDIDRRLARLSGATEGLRPSAGFSSRVMLAIDGIESPAASIFETAWFSARRLVPGLAIAAALAVVWAVQVDGTVDDELATSYASVGFE
jgi:hypothetical protein